jgi:membrane protein DedA with SNARE-associated domain
MINNSEQVPSRRLALPLIMFDIQNYLLSTSSWTYAFVFLAMILNAAFGLPPSELVLLTTAYCIFIGTMSITPSLCSAIAGNLLGALLLYNLFRGNLGVGLLRFSRRIVRSHAFTRRFETTYERHAGVVLCLGRLIPGIRLQVTILAAIARTPIVYFGACSVVGFALWSVFWIGGGLIVLHMSGSSSITDEARSFLAIGLLMMLAALTVAWSISRTSIGRKCQSTIADTLKAFSPITVRFKVPQFLVRELIWHHVPRMLDALDGAIRSRSFRTSSSARERFGPAIQDVIDYLSHFTNSIFTIGQSSRSTHFDPSTDAEASVKELRNAFHCGVNNDIQDSIDWLFPNTDPPPVDVMMVTAEAFSSLQQPSKYGQLNKVAWLLQYLLKADGSTPSSVFDEYMGKVSRLPCPHLHDLVRFVLTNQKMLIDDIRRLSRLHSVPMSAESELLCFYNLANMLIHYIALTGRAVPSFRERELFWAISALHPVQDQYVDEGNADPHTLEVMTDRLRGSSTNRPAIDGSALPIFRLIDIVYDVLPPKQNPLLVHIFLSLQEAQIESLKQIGQCQMDQEELLEITFRKGGYAFALFGYVVRGHLSPEEFRHFFGMGCVFQLMDDIHDVSDDLQSGSDTIFTRLVKNGRPLDEGLFGLFEVQRTLDETTSLISSFRYPSIVRAMEQIGFRYDTFRFMCIQNEYISDKTWCSIKRQIPFSLDSTLEFYCNTSAHEQLDVYRMLIVELLETVSGQGDR